MLSGATNGVAGEIHTTDRGHKYRMTACCTCLFYVFAQIVLVGSRRRGATIVCSGSLIGFSHLIIIGFQFIAIHTVVLLVIMRKLDEHIVAWLHLLLHTLPVCGFLIETLAAGTCLATVVDGDILKKLLKILNPASGNGAALIVSLHGGVANGVYLDGLHLEYAA